MAMRSLTKFASAVSFLHLRDLEEILNISGLHRILLACGIEVGERALCDGFQLIDRDFGSVRFFSPRTSRVVWVDNYLEDVAEQINSL